MCHRSLDGCHVHMLRPVTSFTARGGFSPRFGSQEWVSWLVCYHFNSITEWGLGHFLGALGLFYDRNVSCFIFFVCEGVCFILNRRCKVLVSSNVGSLL